MKTMYVVRHADSSWDTKFLNDFDRPLSNQGISDVKKLAKLFINKNYLCDSIIHSSAIRTTQTANYLNQKLINNNPIKVSSEKFLYLAKIDDVINILNCHIKQYNAIMYVGHNPTITQFVNYMSDASVDYMPTGAMAVIDLKHNKLLESSGKLIDFIYPKKLKFL
tara:strand:- start:296 stop:790 length:495 start_codon:yes stop_codon:yes gene_type:complete